MFSYLRAMLFVLVLTATWSARAQFRPVEIPPTMPTVPTLPPPVQALSPGQTNPSLAAPVPTPSVEPTPPIMAAPAAPSAAVMVPGCPGRADCPPEPEGEGPLSEAAKEIIKEFVKCEVEGKSFDQCLLDDPPPPTLSRLNEDERAQLTGCLGSNDLGATRDFWDGCLARVP